MDLVSCRNLLIYLEPSLQKKALPTFHYALKPEGFLFLGTSESVTGFTDLFEPVDRKHKIFSRKAGRTHAFHLPLKKQHAEHPFPAQRGRFAISRSTEQGEPEGLRDELNSQREADRVTINQYAPPGVLVNADLQILQFRGPTSAYLEPPTGKAASWLKMSAKLMLRPLPPSASASPQDRARDSAASARRTRR